MISLGFHDVRRIVAESHHSGDTVWIDLNLMYGARKLLEQEVTFWLPAGEHVRAGLIAKAINEANAEADRLALLPTHLRPDAPEVERPCDTEPTS